MKIKYEGTRPCVSLCCSGRTTYYFGPENNFVIDVEDMAHASQILSSRLHKFIVVADVPKSVETEPTVVPQSESKAVEAPQPKKGGKKHGKEKYK